MIKKLRLLHNWDCVDVNTYMNFFQFVQYRRFIACATELLHRAEQIELEKKEINFVLETVLPKMHWELSISMHTAYNRIHMCTSENVCSADRDMLK